MKTSLIGPIYLISTNMSSSAVVVRQQLSLRPGAVYGTEPRSLNFTQGSLFSFPLHSTAYDSDAATVRIPVGIRLRLTSASVDRNEMSNFLRTSRTAGGVALKFSSEENGEMLTVWTCDEKYGELFQTGLGIEVDGPRIIRLAAVIEKNIKIGSPVNLNVFGSVCKSDR